jgi:hypothetical protein
MRNILFKESSSFQLKPHQPRYVEHCQIKCRGRLTKWAGTLSAYYRELGLGMKKKKHGQLLSHKEMFKWRTKTS